MIIFKKGDLVRRLEEDWGKVKVGEIYKVEDQNSIGSLTLKGFGGGFVPRNFELASTKEFLEEVLKIK